MSKTRTRRSYRPAKEDVFYYRGFEILKSDRAHDRERWFASRVGADQPVGGYFATRGEVVRAIDAYRDRLWIGVDFDKVEERVMAAQIAAFAKDKRREIGVICGMPYHLMHDAFLRQTLGRLERESSPVFIVDVEGRSNPQLIMGHPDQAPPFLIPPPGHQYITDADVKELEARLLRKEPLIQPTDYLKTTTGRTSVTGPNPNLEDK